MLTPREQRRAAPMAAASSLRGPAADSQLCRSTHAQMTSSNTIDLLLHYPYCHTSRLNLFSLGL